MTIEKTSIDRAFEILDLLDDTTPTVSPEAIVDRLGLTRSTAYRYLKILCNAGLLMQLSRGSYSLGPRVVELERKIQIGDPLLASGRAVMPAHAETVPKSVLILCALWGDRVLCLHQENSDEAGAPDFILTRARGLPFSLFKGAASLSILANLPNARSKSIYLRFAPEISEAGLGDSWADFRKRMLAIRKAGYAMTTGTFDSGLTAVSAPILNDEGDVIGSLTRIVKREHDSDTQFLVSDIRQAAVQFAESLSGRKRNALPETQLEDQAHRDASLLRSITEHSGTG